MLPRMHGTCPKPRKQDMNGFYINTDSLQMVRKHIYITVHINNVKLFMILFLLVPDTLSRRHGCLMRSICCLCFNLVTKSKGDIPGSIEYHPDHASLAREQSDFDVFGKLDPSLYQPGRVHSMCVSVHSDKTFTNIMCRLAVL